MSMTLATLALMAVGEGAKLLQENQGTITKFLQDNRTTIHYSIKSLGGRGIAEAFRSAGETLTETSNQLYDYATHKDNEGGWKKKK